MRLSNYQTEYTIMYIKKDHSGWLSYGEVKKLLLTFNMGPQQIRHHIKLMDKDGDGKVTIDEFKDILRVAKKKTTHTHIDHLMKHSDRSAIKNNSAIRLKIQDSDISTMPSVGRSPNNRGKSPITNKTPQKSAMQKG